jgi:nucleotide-binding universal stress UspA family protein
VFGTIVLGFDESHHAERAARTAAELAKSLGDAIIVVHVQPLVNPGRGGPMASEEPEEAHHVLDAALAMLAEEGATGASGQLHRAPTDRIGELLIEVAAKEHANLIVIGTRGRSDTQSMLFGSVAHHVIHNATTPVLVVRDTDEHEKTT